MDKLPVSEQEKLKKCSNDRLRQKVMNAGKSEAKVKTMSRADLLAACAEHRAQTLVEAASVFVKPAYDPEVEKLRITFEQQKWLQEAVEKKQRLFEQAKLDAELKLREEELKRDEENRKLKAEELRLTEFEIKIEQEKVDRNDALQRHFKNAELEMKQKDVDRHETTVSKIKLFGDALRNSVTRMSNDPVEMISFLKSVEQLYESLEVPTELKAALVRPHLNERARSLVTTLSANVAKDYNKMRDAILAEFKLSPNMYLDRFNNLTCGTEETTVMFASRLKSLLDYYLEACKVKQFPNLRALIICDRIKATLSVPCLRYILSVEATKKKG